MFSHTVFIWAFCYVSMVTGKSVANATTQKYEKCLTDLQCRIGTAQRVLLENTTYCCKEGQKLSITTGLDKVIMRMSQTLSRMFYNTVMKNTLPGYINSNSKDSQSVDSSASDSDNSFSDSESMESRSIQDSQDSLDYMKSRDIWEYLQDIASIDNDRLNARRLSDELKAIVSRSSNAVEVPVDTRAEIGNDGGRDIISEDWNFDKTLNERAITNEGKGRLASVKTTRRGSDIDTLIRKRFITELDVALNDKRRSGQDAWADTIYNFLKKRYLGDNEKTIIQDTDGENIIENDEAQNPAAIFAGIFKRDTGLNSENEDNQRQNRALDSPNSPDVQTRFDRQGDTNDVVDPDKRQQNKDPKPAVGTATKPSGGAQTGPLLTAADKKNRYVLCQCLPG